MMKSCIFIVVALILISIEQINSYRLSIASHALRPSLRMFERRRSAAFLLRAAEENSSDVDGNNDSKSSDVAEADDSAAAEASARAAAEAEATKIPVEELQSKEIARLLKKIESTQQELDTVRNEHAEVAQRITELNAEYGDEIARIKKEFSRMKERAFEEAQLAVNMAKADAVKEVLPVTDNYLRAKSVFKTLNTDNEKRIIETYDAVFESLNSVLNDFGLSKVESIGQPFDFNFMEAITAQPSNEYKKDVVMMEYQVGYRMGDRCVRPAMVVVSQGPGPSS